MSTPRRVPRRSFEANVGILFQGSYQMSRAYQVGEGGLMFASKHKLAVGQSVIASFYVSSQTLVIVRGIVRAVTPPQKNLPERYGIEFQNLEFQARREIRNFVAEATRSEEAY